VAVVYLLLWWHKALVELYFDGAIRKYLGIYSTIAASMQLGN